MGEEKVGAREPAFHGAQTEGGMRIGGAKERRQLHLLRQTQADSANANFRL